MKFVTIISTFLTLTSWSQTISLMDAQGEPVPFAQVALSSLPQGRQVNFQSEMDGRIKFPSIGADSLWVIRISQHGFKTLTDTLKGEMLSQFVLDRDESLLGQVVVTGQYGPNCSENALSKVKVIDRERIESMGAVNLSDVLKNETQIRISQDNVLGSSLSMQGVSGQNVKILIDGVPMVGRLNGNVDLSQINLNDIERIEVVEGPMSVNYGTDALAGTINLITKKGQRDRFNIGVHGYYESAGQYNYDGRFGWRLKNSQIQVSGGRNYFDGWSSTDPFFSFPKSQLADTNRVQQWKPKQQYFGKASFRQKIKTWAVRVYGEFFQEEMKNRGLPRAPYFETAFDDLYFTRRTNGGLDLMGRVGSDYRVHVIAAYNHFQRTKNTFFKDLTTLTQELTSGEQDQDTSIFSTCMSRGSLARSKDSARVNFEIGYDINLTTAHGQRIVELEKSQGDYALYASMEWVVAKGLVLRPGLRVTYNTGYRAPLIPSLHARYRIKNFTLRGSYARGFRAPTLKEQHFEFVDINHNIVGNVDLLAEVSDNAQLHLGWSKHKGDIHTKLELGGYYNDIRNRISLAQTDDGNQYQYVNIGRFKSVGTQAQVALSWNGLKLSVGGAYIGRYSEFSEENAQEYFTLSPEVSGSVSYTIAKLNTTLNLFYKYNGTLPGYQVVDDEVVQTEVEAYSLMDFTVQTHFWKKRIAWSIGAKNLLDVQNIRSDSPSGTAHSTGSGSLAVSWGRTVFTSLKFNLDW